MRTCFDIVLGILGTVVKAFVHALMSSAGVLAACAAVMFAGAYLLRRRAIRQRMAKLAQVISIER
jgi:hypothetical protein